MAVAAEAISDQQRASGIEFSENSLRRHGKGSILGILRLLLGRVRSFGVAQDDKFIEEAYI